MACVIQVKVPHKTVLVCRGGGGKQVMKRSEHAQVICTCSTARQFNVHVAMVIIRC